MIRRLLISCLLAGFVGSASAQTAEDSFARGNEAYRGGQFTEAIREYTDILRQGYVSAPLSFNLGNSYFRTGDIARAILWYERAARLDPGDPDIDFNLRLANLRTVDRIEPVPELFFVEWIRSLSNLLPVSLSVSVLLAAWILGFVLLAVLNFFPGTRWNAVLRWGILASLVLVLAAGALLVLEWRQASDTSEAIIMSSSVTAKNSPDSQSVDAFVIHEGLKVRVSDSVGEWIRITLADGKVGWIRSGELERI